LIEFAFIWIKNLLYYYFEAKSDLAGNKEKYFDTFMMTVYHGSWIAAILFWFEFSFFGFVLAALELCHRGLHDIMINAVRKKELDAKFTADNDEDWFDKIHVKIYARGFNLVTFYIFGMVTLTAAYVLLFWFKKA